MSNYPLKIIHLSDVVKTFCDLFRHLYMSPDWPVSHMEIIPWSNWPPPSPLLFPLSLFTWRKYNKSRPFEIQSKKTWKHWKRGATLVNKNFLLLLHIWNEKNPFLVSRFLYFTLKYPRQVLIYFNDSLKRFMAKMTALKARIGFTPRTQDTMNK